MKAAPFLAFGLAAVLTQSVQAAPDNRSLLIIQDRLPGMDSLAGYLKAHGGLETKIVGQDAAPSDLSAFKAVLLYVDLYYTDAVENSVEAYVKGGGRLVVIHHSISGKKQPKWLDFVGMRLTGGGTPLAAEPSQPGGHYAFRFGISQTIVNVQPKHYITSNGIKWPETVDFKPEGAAASARLPAQTIKATESYMNFVPLRPGSRRPILGFKYKDDRNGAEFMQNTAGWTERIGKGQLVYLQPGHFGEEFQDSILDQMILNSITWRPGP